MYKIFALSTFFLASTALTVLPAQAQDEDEGLYDTWGVWTPDGEMLWSYSYGYSDDAELFTIRPDGADRVRQTENDGNDWFPQISSDGAYLLFTSDRGYGPFEASQVYVRDRATGEEWTVSEGDSLKLTAHWSPDNNWISYASHPTEDSLGRDVYIVSRDGRERRRITHTEGANEMGVSFHPDGRRLIWSENAAEDTPRGERQPPRRVVEYDLETGETRELISAERDASYPQWSPDGSQFLFTGRDADGNADIYLADANGGHIRQLTHSPESDHSGHWSPDGTRITFASYRWGRSEVYIMNADGSEERNVTRTTRDAD